MSARNPQSSIPALFRSLMRESYLLYDPGSPKDWLASFQEEYKRLGVILGPEIQFPPNCFVDMRGVFVRYESRMLLVTKFPVLEEHLNPVRVMQGGYIAAAIDNTMGPLSYFAARRPCLTLDLHVQFIRAAAPGETLTVTGRVVSRGSRTMVLSAEVLTDKGKLAAQASANVVVLDDWKGAPTKKE